MADARVVPGRLIEQPSPHGSGTERQAHGEFIAPGGELASYAIGWTTGGEHDFGLLSVGIGVGNPGGGTFHAQIVDHDGAYGLRLVDEPFADVPQGGPDFTRSEALAHEDLPFIWYVADLVMARDPRAWWLNHWLTKTTAVMTMEVFTRVEPILYVQHDEDDGMWQLFGTTGAGDEGSVSHLSHLIDDDPTLVPILDLPPGGAAERHTVGGPWERRISS